MRSRIGFDPISQQRFFRISFKRFQFKNTFQKLEVPRLEIHGRPIPAARRRRFVVLRFDDHPAVRHRPRDIVILEGVVNPSPSPSALGERVNAPPQQIVKLTDPPRPSSLPGKIGGNQTAVDQPRNPVSGPVIRVDEQFPHNARRGLNRSRHMGPNRPPCVSAVGHNSPALKALPIPDAPLFPLVRAQEGRHE